MTSERAILRPFPLKAGLAPNPERKTPIFAKTIKNKAGQAVSLGDPRATRALVALMNQHAVIGGAACHWGGPAAFAEMMSAVHGLMFNSPGVWFDNFNFVNDAGHAENGLYALRANYEMGGLTLPELKKFRSLESRLTGHGEAHLNPAGVLISNGPLGSGLPQAQGLALSDKITGKNRLTICTISDGGSMEGEAREAFAAIPGWAKKGLLNPFLLLISDNNTKLSGRIDKDCYSMSPTFNSLSALGWNVTFVEEGHDLEKVYQAIETGFEKLKNQAESPVAIIFRTIKGKGIQATEQSASGGHGYPLKAYDPKLGEFLKEIYQGESVPQEFDSWAKEILASAPTKSNASASSGPKREKVQVGLSKALIKMAKQGLPIISVASDVQGSTGVADFHKNFPERSFDVGIAEANMVSTAVGLSRSGHIPVVDTFAQFGITKGNLPLMMSGLSLGPVIGLFSHTGFQDAADGASHQATTYFAATACIPHIQVLSVSTSSEAEYYLEQAILQFERERLAGRVPATTLFFYGRENFCENNGTTKYEWGQGQLVREGRDILLVGTGPTTELAIEAAELLAKQGIEASVYNHIFINRPETETFKKLLAKNKNTLITVEDHQLIGGMGATLIHNLVVNSWQGKAAGLGIEGHFGQSAYLASHLYKKHGFDAQGIAQRAKGLIGQ
ncbi:MAG: transketolase [Bdellovibrionales bacterium GWA2_49_15]|nr:MAG: transketolase [Bdellovibrionales bacterium GWA2_49_15]HAZ12157.1 transketolase [Bdellovibrionales bacterium]